MNVSKKSSALVIGLALFSMFFGSGNLIYPLFVGKCSSSEWFINSLGFLMTAVLLPFLGVIAMVLFKGDYQSFFKVLGKKMGFLFSLLLLTIWIPLGSAPRCIALAFSSISAYMYIGPIWIFAFFYSLLVFFIISMKVGFLNILGKIITPLLIGAILVIFFIGLEPNKGEMINAKNNLAYFWHLLGLIFFSASIVSILFKKLMVKQTKIKMIIKSFIIVISLFCIGPIWILSLMYATLILFVIKRKEGFLNVLGKSITPIIIGSIVILFLFGLKPVQEMQISTSNFSFFQSLKEGYNTMDLIASFFFSASIINILFKKSKSMRSSVKMIIKSSIIGMFILAFVYIILIFTSSKYGYALEGVKKDQLLVYLSQIILGAKFSIVSLLAILLACFSTSVALVIVYSDFLKTEVFKNKKDANFSMILAIAITFVMSLFGLEGITFITAPVLKISYPMLLGLISINIVKIMIQERKVFVKKEIETARLINKQTSRENQCENN